MSWYYVKDTGTATGDGGRYASQQTGSFAGLGTTTTYYGSIALAFGATTTPVSGDFILVSDSHAGSFTSDQVYTGPTTGEHVHVVSVADLNIDQYAAGGAETTTANNADFNITGRVTCSGVNLTPDDDLAVTSVDGHLHYKDATITSTGSTDKISVGFDGSSITLENVTWHYTNAASFISISGGSVFKWFGGALTAASGATDLFFAGFQSGGGTVEIEGVDLSEVTDNWLAAVGSSAANDDTISAIFRGCKVNASLNGFVESAFASPNMTFEAYNCSTTSDSAEYQFYKQTWTGTAEDDTTTYRVESTAFPGGEKVSIKTFTSSPVSEHNTFSFDLPARFAELSSASTDTIRVYFTSDTTLDDNEVWAELLYPDGTNKNVYNYLSNRNTDILAAGTTHTTDAVSTWNSGKTNKYQMDLDTSGDVGADSVPIIRIHVGVAATIFFDTTVDVVA